MNKLTTSTLKLINDNRKTVKIVSNLLASADNDCLSTFIFFDMDDQKSKDDSLMKLSKIENDNLGTNITLWLCQDQMDRDSDTWRGINRCFQVSKRDINKLIKLGIVTDDPFFDDGTLFIDVDLRKVAELIDRTFTNSAIDSMINDFQDAMKKIQAKIDVFDGFQNI